MPTLTASILYDFSQCPQRVALDAFGEPQARDPINPFVRLLWERGTLFERETIAKVETPYLDLAQANANDREALTRDAMLRGEPLIYGGRLAVDDLVGEPDLLRKELGGYIPGDIKSGRAEEGGDDDHEGKPKLHYAVQLALYVDILERTKLSAARRAFVWDIRGEEVAYDFSSGEGAHLWDEYVDTISEARSILAGKIAPRAAYSSICKLCHWHTHCVQQLTNDDDLTLIPFLRRSDRDLMFDQIPTIETLAQINPEGFTKGKKSIFPGIGSDRLRILHLRATILKASPPRARLREPVRLDQFAHELFFDVEVDPLRGVCYLHGFVERRDGNVSNETYHHFFCDDPVADAERAAFAAALDFLAVRRDAAIYYYSKYERTIYRRLQQKYPDVCTPDDVERLFKTERAIDLYTDVVLKATDWPTRDHSLKTLAKFLGFDWRDNHPSGAASVEWFDRWCRTRAPEVRQRILEYNEDDCRATRVLLDGIRAIEA